MDVSHFVSPLQAVQVISIFSYMNTLNDFLFAEKLLPEHEQHKRIPIINALYHYLLDHNGNQLNLQQKKLIVVQKLIQGSDLYGAKESEKLDPHFVNRMINHIVESVVFEKFSNIYGFIADVIRFTERETYVSVLHYMKKTLIGLRFENEYGEDSELKPLAIDRIFQDLILPLFPEPKTFPVNIRSIDYLYAQAGLMFIRSGQLEPTSDTIRNRSRMIKTEIEDTGNAFQEYVEIAHTVEQLVLAKKLNKSAMKIFALPALINYVYKEKNSFQEENIVNIINKPRHWRNAYRELLTYMKDAFLSMDNVTKQNYRYQFYMALNNYKNRTTLAKEAIEIECPPLTDKEIEQEVDKYKNNPDSFQCKNGSRNKLYDLNKHFQELVANITNKYYIFEKESCRAAFGEDFIKSMDNTNVEISKGLIRYYYTESISTFDTPKEQLVKKENDLFQFYFPDNNTYTYYALVRNGYNVSMIKEAENPTLFRETIGLGRDQPFRSNFFPTVLKTKTEKFEDFLTKIANERKKLFTLKLESGYDQTRKEWWIDFGKSLIPFYSCIKDIEERNAEDASFVCPLDVLFFVPVGFEMGVAILKSEKAAIKVAETTLRTMTLRCSMQETLRISSKVLIEEIGEFTQLFTINNLGTSVLRFIDPGFELLFSIGKNGFRSIKTLVRLSKRNLSISSSLLNTMLETTSRAIDNFSKSLGKKFGKDIYVNSLSKESGYGYKIIPLRNGNAAEIRTVSQKETPLVSRVSIKHGKVYNEVNLETEEIIGKDFFDDEGVIVSEPRTFELFIKHGSVSFLESPNLICKSCTSHKERLSEAVEFVLNNRKLSEKTVRQELKKYVFPYNGKTELDFVKDWTTNDQLKVPEWGKNCAIDEPEIFYDLRNKNTFDVPEISEAEAKRRIEAIYPLDGKLGMEKGFLAMKLSHEYTKKEAFQFLTFEDYFSLQNYGLNGYKIMAGNSAEARQMKNAIYRLAIKQSEDPIEEYSKILFRGESRLSTAAEKLLRSENKEFILKGFTSATTDEHIALRFTREKGYPYRKIVYEMEFSKPYLRAKVSDLFVLPERETILMPGTKFRIDQILWETAERNYIKVKLSHMHESMTKSEWQKETMREIKKLKESGTVFYAKDALLTVRRFKSKL